MRAPDRDRRATLPKVSLPRGITDGKVVIRSPKPGDAAVLITGRDEIFHRFLGLGSDEPCPTGCIVVDGKVVGWVDYDLDRAWLEPGEVNVGYNVFARHRGRGYASRAVQLLMHHLAVDTCYHTATLLIHAGNDRSLDLARRTNFTLSGVVDGNPYFKRPVPPFTYTDGIVTIRRQTPEDIGADLEAKDDEQIDWLWLPGQRERWEAMTPDEQRNHAIQVLRANHNVFGTGPTWTFAVDAAGTTCVAHVDCDLANQDVPPGEANISYSSHPAHRGRGYVSRAVRLILEFLHDHTGAREAHIITDADNRASRRVAAAVGARPAQRWVTERGRTMIRHVRHIHPVESH